MAAPPKSGACCDACKAIYIEDEGATGCQHFRTGLGSYYAITEESGPTEYPGRLAVAGIGLIRQALRPPELAQHLSARLQFEAVDRPFGCFQISVPIANASPVFMAALSGLGEWTAGHVKEDILEGGAPPEVPLELCRSIEGHDPTAIEDRNLVAQPVGFLHVVGGEEDRCSGPGQVGDQVSNIPRHALLRNSRKIPVVLLLH